MSKFWNKKDPICNKIIMDKDFFYDYEPNIIDFKNFLNKYNKVDNNYIFFNENELKFYINISLYFSKKENIIGTISLCLVQYNNNITYGVTTNLCIRDDLRNKAYATYLIHKIMVLAKEKNVIMGYHQVSKAPNNNHIILNSYLKPLNQEKCKLFNIYFDNSNNIKISESHLKSGFIHYTNNSPKLDFLNSLPNTFELWYNDDCSACIRLLNVNGIIIPSCILLIGYNIIPFLEQLCFIYRNYAFLYILINGSITSEDCHKINSFLVDKRYIHFYNFIPENNFKYFFCI